MNAAEAYSLWVGSVVRANKDVKTRCREHKDGQVITIEKETDVPHFRIWHSDYDLVKK